MKTNLKKLIPNILAFAAVLALAVLVLLFIGSDLLVCAPRQAETDAVSSSDSGLTSEEMTIPDGISTKLSFVAVEGVEYSWSSSNEDVVSCLDGMITTHCAGEAFVTVTGAGETDYIRITVTDSAAGDAAKLVAKLADTGSVMTELYTMCARLEMCTGSRALTMRELLGMLKECAYGNSRTQEELTAAAQNAGLEIQTVLDAAALCWSAGQAELHSAVISFTGDVTLGRCNEKAAGYYFPAVYSAQDSLTYPFDRVKQFFLTDDLTVINFEGTLTESEDRADKAFCFRGDPSYASMLSAAGIDAATLANNHAMDYHKIGYEDTVRYLSAAGVAVFDEDKPAEYTIKTKDGNTIRVALFAYNLIGNTRPKPDSDSLELIAQYKADPNTVVIASVHWGTEYSQRLVADQTNFGHNLIEAGVDLVVGHHPHIIQGIEYYEGKYIAYSLGNFAFAGNTEAKNPQTFILQANVDYVDGAATVSGISVVPCHTTSTGTIVNNYQPCVQFGSKSADVMQLLLKRSGYTKYGAEELRWSGI